MLSLGRILEVLSEARRGYRETENIVGLAKRMEKVLGNHRFDKEEEALVLSYYLSRQASRPYKFGSTLFFETNSGTKEEIEEFEKTMWYRKKIRGVRE